MAIAFKHCIRIRRKNQEGFESN